MNCGWLAECHSCPTTLGGYGERVKVHQEFADEPDAKLWAHLHRDLHKSHHVTVTQFEHITFTHAEVNHDVMRALFSNPTEKE